MKYIKDYNNYITEQNLNITKVKKNDYDLIVKKNATFY
jgi:hypothetical protein